MSRDILSKKEADFFFRACEFSNSMPLPGYFAKDLFIEKMVEGGWEEEDVVKTLNTLIERERLVEAEKDLLRIN